MDPTAQSALKQAQLAWQCGAYETAVAGFAALPSRFPNEPAVLGPVARAHLALGEFEQARKVIERALSAASPPPDCALLAALFQIGADDAAAIARLQDVARSFPHWPLPRIGLHQLAGLSVDGFPASDVEAAYGDSTDWLLARSDETVGRSLWVDFPVRVLDRALQAARDGLIVECGVFHGRSLNYLAARARGPLHGFDSFQGLPKAWLGSPQGAYSTHGQLPAVASNVTLHRGWFDDTLPPFAAEHRGERIAILHIDCDLYESTQSVFRALDGLIDDRTIIVLDDFHGFAEWRRHEARALMEWLTDRGVSAQVIAAAPMAREVALRAV